MNKALTLTKRIIDDTPIGFNLDTDKVTMNGKQCSLKNFIDLIKLSCSRVKPVIDKTFLGYLDFLRVNAIPLRLIVNPYIRSRLIAFDTKKGRKGRAAMPPKLRDRKTWFSSLEDIKEMAE